MYLLILSLFCLLIILVESFRIIDFGKPSGFLISGVVLPHFVLIAYFPWRHGYLSLGWSIVAGVVLFILYSCFFWRMHMVPYKSDKGKKLKLKALMGGRINIIFSFWSLVCQCILYAAFFLKFVNDEIRYDRFTDVDKLLFLIDGIWCACTVIGLMANGVLRVIFLSRQLGIWRRVLIILFFWVPIVHQFIFIYLCKIAREEFDFERFRMEKNELRVESELCKTRYPIVMVHGVGFRDVRWFNYWGRIPGELQKNGATIYYGHQEGWAVLEKNAEVIKQKIYEVMKENNCDKVNIIAHSKGGLDSRYAMCELGMAEHVASLTTICTPHRGSQLIPVLRRLPDSVYKSICRIIDDVFRKYGDVEPDVYHSSLQLSPEFCEQFNEKYPNVEGVYYQSYASVMRNCFSNSILSIPFLLMKMAAGPNNDGLVEEESAKWGVFKETFRTSHGRGISHGDMIDLQRRDYKGFDVLETYVKMVSELKNMGF